MRAIFNIPFFLFLGTISFTSCKKDPSLNPELVIPIQGNYNPSKIGNVRTYAHKFANNIDTISRIVVGDTILKDKLYMDIQYGVYFSKEFNNYYELFNVYGINREYLILKDNAPVGTKWTQINYDGLEETIYTVLNVNIEKVVAQKTFQNVIQIRSVQKFGDNIETIDTYFAKDIGIIYKHSPGDTYNAQSSLINYSIK